MRFRLRPYIPTAPTTVWGLVGVASTAVFEEAQVEAFAYLPVLPQSLARSLRPPQSTRPFSIVLYHDRDLETASWKSTRLKENGKIMLADLLTKKMCSEFLSRVCSQGYGALSRAGHESFLSAHDVLLIQW